MYIMTMSAPLMSFITTLTYMKNMQLKTIQNTTCFMLFFSWINSSMMLYECMTNHTHCQTKLWNWMETEYLTCKMSLHTDILSSSMLFTMTLISLLMHLYSTEYMNNDPHTLRFMSYLSLFTFFMLILMSSNNYMFLLMGWEGVGMCSYLLMNFWYTRTLANKSGIKAIMMNRMGDITLLMSTMMMLKKFGSTKFETLTHTHEMTNNHTHFMCILLLLSAIGKSSLMGLHVWLPDAMEGPTPVSALMHAATMVTAGMFMLMRSSSILEESKMSLMITAWIGAMTAFFAASMGSTQNDMKRMMAYSTCSQLGYMALAMGISKYSMSLLHLMNHAFFKSLLFLGTGMAMHTMSNEQDIRKLSNLMTHTPMTYMSLLMGSLTMTGIPFLTAHFSKEQMMEHSTSNSMLYTLTMLTTTLTAFYSTRLLYFIFMKQPQYLTRKKKKFFLPMMNITLTLLMILSMMTGYMTLTLMNTHTLHPMTPQMSKNLPFYCSTMSSMSMLFLYQKKNLSNSYKQMSMKNFLSNAWNFNTLYNNMMSEKILNMTHTQSYKNTDKGLMEKIINNNMTKQMMEHSKLISNSQSSKMSQHMMTLTMSYMTFTLMTNLSNSMSIILKK